MDSISLFCRGILPVKRSVGKRGRNVKRVWTIIKTVCTVSVTVVAIAVAAVALISAVVFNRSDRGIFGYQLYTVTSDSMSATHFSAGDLILVKAVDDPATLQEGDVITFLSQNRASFGETVTHRIRRITVTETGERAFVTYGTTTDTDDEVPVTALFLIGKYEGRVPALGRFFEFMKTPAGYLVCIFLPFSVLIAFEGIKCGKLWRRYRIEQQAEQQAEKDALEEENRRMREELEALKAGSVPSEE